MTRTRFLVLVMACFTVAVPLAFVHWAHGRAQLHVLGTGERHFDPHPLMPATPIRGHGSLDVRFRIAHSPNIPEPQRYQVLLLLSTMADATPIAKRIYKPYVMAARERRQDEFAHTFEGLAPGDYCVEIELLNFTPCYNMDGTKRGDFASIHKEGWWAEVD